METARVAEATMMVTLVVIQTVARRWCLTDGRRERAEPEAMMVVTVPKAVLWWMDSWEAARVLVAETASMAEAEVLIEATVVAAEGEGGPQATRWRGDVVVVIDGEAEAAVVVTADANAVMTMVVN